MKIITRHSAGGYRSAMSALLSEEDPPDLRADALRSAFIWDDHALGAEFWHRNWGRLMRGEELSKEARNMAMAMAREKPRTIFAVDSRDHDRVLLRRITQSRLNPDHHVTAA